MSLRVGHKLMIFISLVLPAKGLDFSYKILQKLLKDVENKDYHLSTLRKEYSILKKDGYIEHKSRYRKKIPVLTQKGRLAIKTILPFKSYDTWDGTWRVVIFDIPEKERKYRWALRDKLTRLGFGKLQKSAYISPYPFLNSVNHFGCELGIRQHLRFLEISKIDNEKKLVEKTWNLEKINKDYQEFIQKIKNIQKDKFWVFQTKKLEQEFLRIYENDPHLPEIFLPKNWSGKEAYGVFKAISNSY